MDRGGGGPGGGWPVGAGGGAASGDRDVPGGRAGGRAGGVDPEADVEPRELPPPPPIPDADEGVLGGEVLAGGAPGAGGGAGQREGAAGDGADGGPRVLRGRSIATYKRPELLEIIRHVALREPELGDEQLVELVGRLLGCPEDESLLVGARLRYAVEAFREENRAAE